MKIRTPLLFALLLCALWARADYRSIVLETGVATSQSVLVVADKLYVFSVDESGRHYRTGTADANYSLESKVYAIKDQVIFFDVMQTANGPTGVLISSGEARTLDTDQRIVSFDSIYQAPVVDALPHFDSFRDLNGDGLDDFLMPSFSGYEVAVQKPDGSFTLPVSLAAPPLMDMSYNNHPWYQAKNLFLADMDLDGRQDVVFWDDDQFVVYPQLDSGGFDRQSFLIPSQISLDYDGLDGMSVRMSNEDQSNKTVTVVYGIQDYNGDDLPDLMIMRVNSSGVFRKKTTFSLHPGLAGKDRHVVFAMQPASSIESKGIQYDMEARDLDGDSDLDLIVSSVELGVGKIIAALLTSSVKIELGIFSMKEGGYSQKPDTTREITATFSLSSGEFWQPAVLIHDATGDGRADLLLQDGNKLELYAGEATADLFGSRLEPILSPMPRDPDLIESVDINSDGVIDLLMRIPPRLDEPDGQHQVVLLISGQ
jgi:hypothetical protein